jgi:hypothetical protein
MSLLAMPTSFRFGSMASLSGLLAILSAPTCTEFNSPEPPVHLGQSTQALRRAPVLVPLGGLQHAGAGDESAAEILTFDPDSARLFVTNRASKRVDIVDARDPSTLVQVGSIDVTALGDHANSVAVRDGVVAAAIEASDPQAPGTVAFFDVEGQLLSSVVVGALPDMLTFTRDGTRVLVANEGEPSTDYGVDPEGSISIIDLRRGARRVSPADVETADFRAFDRQELDPGVRIFGLGASVAQDLEPEYIAVSDDSRRAWVTLQENNAVAVVDIERARVTRVAGLGLKDHSLPGNGLDVLDTDRLIDIDARPLFGLYQPDAIAAFKVRGKEYLLTVNEGDQRTYGDFVEAANCVDLPTDSLAFPPGSLGPELARIDCSRASGDVDGDGDHDQLHVFGGRSFSILDSRMQPLFESGDLLERITAEELPDQFNSTDNRNDSLDSRSDDRGPEPEGVTVGEVRGRFYAFVALERVGGIVVFDVTRPAAPRFIEYVNTRDFSGATPEGSDAAPEGLAFIPGCDSPTGKALLAVAFEVSGTTRMFEFD